MKGYIYGFLGNAYLIKYQRERAINCFEKALKNNTKNILAIYNYGISHIHSSLPGTIPAAK